MIHYSLGSSHDAVAFKLNKKHVSMAEAGDVEVTVAKTGER